MNHISTLIFASKEVLRIICNTSFFILLHKAYVEEGLLPEKQYAASTQTVISMFFNTSLNIFSTNIINIKRQ
ncbi:hypothetical protein EZS27_021264 [termite gut metagenome]|uniref:Uncharacterized protein n=1 Tax=termite gut metagenome TaxID=433724 RepID=A0A5J4R8G6_9ZZZZ